MAWAKETVEVPVRAVARDGRGGTGVPGVVLLALLVCGGCFASHTQKIRGAHEAFYAGDFESAAETLRSQMKAGGKRSEALSLDLATVELASGNPRAAEILLRDARDRLDQAADGGAVESIAVLATDDAARAYGGTGYEQVMVRVLASLANLMSDGVDAEAYALQAYQHQEKLAQVAGDSGVTVPEGLFQPVAFAPYVRGVLRESTLHDFDDANRAYAQVAAISPNFQLVSNDIQRVGGGIHSPRGHGAVYVFALVGRGPIRQPEAAEVTSDALLVADRILSVVGNHSLPPTIAPVMVPTIVIPEADVKAIAVGCDGRWLVRTETITDVGQLAINTYDAERPRVIGRAVCRRVMKKAAIYAAKEGTGIHHPLGELAFDAVGVAWEATERCDTRCWGLLPREIQVARIELPEGEQALNLQVVSPYGQMDPSGIQVRVPVEDGGNTYVLLFAPDDRILSAMVRVQ